ncbi:hypothetical protein KW787_02435 [Candidatus Pacearchaeota archaeon]|nr:hypothetical protein [Candidatus Pacearchaeota archaeon]
MKKGVRIFLIVVLAVALLLAYYLTFFYKTDCTDMGCFQEAMRQCKHATYINEDPEASWKYDIQGSDGGACNIEVTLLQAKKGDLELDKLAGYDMICSYALGVVNYPEKSLNTCHGRLKEEIQRILIEKLHTHILDNIDKISQNLNSYSRGLV